MGSGGGEVEGGGGEVPASREIGTMWPPVKIAPDCGQGGAGGIEDGVAARERGGGWCRCRGDNPQVQGIIIAISKGGSDKYGVSNPQGPKAKINILSSPICHYYDSTYTERLLPTRNKK